MIKLYSRKTKELNGEGVMQAIKDALEDYENGDLLDCKNTLLCVVVAIDAYLQSRRADND